MTLETTVEPIIAISGVISQNKTTVTNLKIPIINIATEGEQLIQLVKKHLKAKPS
jgi:hypothetical protein